MRAILCYGDSNTFGYSVEGDRDGRYAQAVRWPGILQAVLGEGWCIQEAGLSGRTTVTDDPVEGVWKNGRTSLLPIIHSHKPLDWVTVMLGTNDLKIRFNKAAKDITEGVATLINDIKKEAVGVNAGTPKILLIAPAPINQKFVGEDAQFRGRQALSLELKSYYQKLADNLDIYFLDAAEYVAVSEFDGVHLSAESHRVLGEAVALKVSENSK